MNIQSWRWCTWIISLCFIVIHFVNILLDTPNMFHPPTSNGFIYVFYSHPSDITFFMSSERKYLSKLLIFSMRTSRHRINLTQQYKSLPKVIKHTSVGVFPILLFRLPRTVTTRLFHILWDKNNNFSDHIICLLSSIKNCSGVSLVLLKFWWTKNSIGLRDNLFLDVKKFDP